MANRTCSVEGCGRGGKITRGWCSKHYSRWQSNGDPNVARTNKTPPANCTLDGCDSIHYARGWCSSHYRRHRLYGNPLAGEPERILGDDAARFWSKVDKSDDCWAWLGNKGRGGYGYFWFDGRMVIAHRYAYELLVGPISDGLTIDHLCRNPGCVRAPDHLEPVTQAENNRRRWAS